jgi:hypothetical protein
MEITTTIERSDLIRLALLMLFRAKANWIFVGVLSLVLFALLALEKRPSTFYAISVLVGIAFLGGVAGLIAGMICQLIVTFLTIDKKGGVLGAHTYGLTERGLQERTDWNEGIQLWQGIQSIRRVGNYVIFQVNSYQYHIIAKRAFGSASQFDAFWIEANRLWKAA